MVGSLIMWPCCHKNEPTPGRYQLHDLLREHACTLAAADNPVVSNEAIGRLLDYYLHTALAAGQHFTPWASACRRPAPCVPPAQAPGVSTLGQAAAWLDAERANLHAADYAADSGRSPHAIAMAAAMGGFLIARGHWDQSTAMHQTALAAARRADDRLGEADTLAELGIVQRETGDYHHARAAASRSQQRRPSGVHSRGSTPRKSLDTGGLATPPTSLL